MPGYYPGQIPTLPHFRPMVRTPLKVWLEKKGVTQTGMAKMLGCQDRMVKLWANNQALPGLIYAFKIERVTKGGVPAASWLGTPLGQKAWAAGQSKFRNLRVV